MVTPPLITIPPGPPPATKERPAGNGPSGDESRLNAARENPARNGIQHVGREDVRLLQARHLHAAARVRREQGVGQGDQAVAVVDGVGRRERIAIADGVVGRRVPKSSRMVCLGLLYENAVPLGRPFTSNSGPLGCGQKEK